MRDHSHHIELSREDAVAGILARCEFTPSVEELPISEAFGRVLAEDAFAKVTLPNCLTCSMDSVALRWEDFASGELPDTTSWVRGEKWQFANTGVGMPEGFDTAVVIENVEVIDEAHVKVLIAPSAQYAGTQPAGSRMHEGDLVATRGTQVTPVVAAALTGAGHTTARVLAKPRVVFIPTGNELAEAGQPLGRGQNIESNSMLVIGKVAEWGGVASATPIVRDEPQKLREAITKACEQADIVVLNAGSSKGSDDWGIEMLEEIGEVLNHETNHGPGHHSSYAIVNGTPVVGISGPALGAAFTTDFYLKPLIDLWFGRSSEPRRVKARLMAPFNPHKPAQGQAPKASSSQAPAQKVAAPRGEDRPSVVRDTPFFAIQHLKLSQGPDGVLEATPLKFRPSLMEADSSDGYYALDRGSAAGVPEVGDLIDVEIRYCR